MKAVINFSFLFYSTILFSQNQTLHEFYNTDSNIIKLYNHKFYLDNDNFKDSLEDGKYVVLKKSKHHQIDTLNICYYINGKKNGLFQTFGYDGDNRLSHFENTYFINGEKNGISKKYRIRYIKKKKIIYLESIKEYKNGKLNGIMIVFKNEIPLVLSYYENGVLIYKSNLEMK
jgi:hypothetical protein